jgi:integrase
VDLKHGFILLDISKNGERREIPINTTLEYLFKEIPHNVESVYVFAGKNGNPLTDIKHSFHTALKDAGIIDFRFHDLRHTFASHLVMAGVDLTSVKELLGHKDIAMTLRYSHLAPGHKRKAVQVLDKIMENSEGDVFGNGYKMGTISKKANIVKVLSL